LDDGQVFVNKWGVKKTTFCSKNHKSNNPVTWISKYGSITFTQYGCEFATSGINEAGLV
jgi:penicillin V acylase-like amidase (Ntn superfamily)